MLGNFCCIRPLNSAVGVVLVLNVLYLVLFLIRVKVYVLWQVIENCHL